MAANKLIKEKKKEIANKQIKTVGVVGNPNAGKTTIINAIAKSRLKVGNWPGVTVEKKEALMDYKGSLLRIVDLPGTYSLTPFAEDEAVVEKFLLEEKVDVIINIIDSTNLERGLYLTIQLMELGIPMLIALNMVDEGEKRGLSFDIDLIEHLLNIKVVATVASKKKNIDTLLDELINIPNKAYNEPKDLHYGEDLETVRVEIEAILKDKHKALLSKYPLKWLVYKLIESDGKIDQEKVADIEKLTSHLKTAHSKNIVSFVGSIRHGLAAGITKQVVHRKKTSRVDITEKVDRVVLSRFGGAFLFAFSMFLLFQMTFGLANPFIDWINGPLTALVLNISTQIMDYLVLSDWLKSLLIEGLISGVGTVITFVPLVFFMMFFISFLEGSGYMARVAFVMDKIMRSIGLHGKSFIPMLLGFGCNVAGIYATRNLESRKDRVITALVMPLMSCSGRLPVYGILASIFFSAYVGLVTFLMYFIGIIIALFMIAIFRKLLFSEEESYFIMELPPYRMPTLKYLLIHGWGKARFFVVQAGTWITAAMIIVWALNNLPWDPSRTNKQDNLLGTIGSGLAYLTTPLGFGTKLDKDGKEVLHWEAGAALLTGIVAKELVVGSLGQLYGDGSSAKKDKPTLDYAYEAGVGFIDTSYLALKNLVTLGFLPAENSVGSGTDDTGYKTKIASAFTPLTAFVYILFTLLYMPCVVTAVAYKNELGSWKYFYISALYSFTIAWTLSFIVYRVGSLFIG